MSDKLLNTGILAEQRQMTLLELFDADLTVLN